MQRLALLSLTLLLSMVAKLSFAGIEAGLYVGTDQDGKQCHLEVRAHTFKELDVMTNYFPSILVIAPADANNKTIDDETGEEKLRRGIWAGERSRDIGKLEQIIVMMNDEELPTSYKFILQVATTRDGKMLGLFKECRDLKFDPKSKKSGISIDRID